MHLANLLPLAFLGDPSTKFRPLLLLPGTITLRSLYTGVTGSLPTRFVTPRRSCFRSAKRRVSSRSSGSVSFCPILRSAISLIRYSRRASVDTEKLNLESEELFDGTAVKLQLQQSQMIKASTAYSWRATGPGLTLARGSTGIH